MALRPGPYVVQSGRLTLAARIRPGCGNQEPQNSCREDDAGADRRGATAGAGVEAEAGMSRPAPPRSESRPRWRLASWESTPQCAPMPFWKPATWRSAGCGSAFGRRSRSCSGRGPGATNLRTEYGLPRLAWGFFPLYTSSTCVTNTESGHSPWMTTT